MASAWIALFVFLVVTFVDNVGSAESTTSPFGSSPTSSSSSLLPSPSTAPSSSVSQLSYISSPSSIIPLKPAPRSSSLSSSSSSSLSSTLFSASLMVISTSVSSTASITTSSSSISSPTQPPDLSSVDTESIGSTRATLTLRKKEFLTNGRRTSYVQVIVIQLKEDQNLEVSTHEKYSEANIYRDYKVQVEGEPYITAEFNYGTIKFRIGDGKYYSRSVQRQRQAIGSREYYNGELKEGANYAVFQRSFDEYGSYESENFIHFTTKKSSRTAVIIVSVVLVVPLLLILLVFSVDAGCRYISKGQKTTSGTRIKKGHTLITGKETVEQED